MRFFLCLTLFAQLIFRGAVFAQFNVNTINLTDVQWLLPDMLTLKDQTLVTSAEKLMITVAAKCSAPLSTADFQVIVDNQPVPQEAARCVDNVFYATVLLSSRQSQQIYVRVIKGKTNLQTPKLTIQTPLPQFTKRYALVIGNTTYKHGSSLSDKPLNDATDVTNRLKELGFTVISKNNADKMTMERSLRDFSRLIEGADVAIFFYAGHGIETGGRNYLLPVDSELNDPDDADLEAIDVQSYLDKLKKSQAKFSIAILDACRNNPFKNWTSSTRGEVERGFRPIANLQGIGNMYLAMATGWGNVAQNGTGRNGIYTEALLNNLKKGALLDDVLNRAAIDVKKRTNNIQNPQLLVEPTSDVKFIF